MCFETQCHFTDAKAVEDAWFYSERPKTPKQEPSPWGVLSPNQACNTLIFHDFSHVLFMSLVWPQERVSAGKTTSLKTAECHSNYNFAGSRPSQARDELTDELTGRIHEFVHKLNQCNVPWEAVHCTEFIHELQFVHQFVSSVDINSFAQFVDETICTRCKWAFRRTCGSRGPRTAPRIFFSKSCSLQTILSTF